jgi:hypothetical protein
MVRIEVSVCSGMTARFGVNLKFIFLLRRQVQNVNNPGIFPGLGTLNSKKVRLPK